MKLLKFLPYLLVSSLVVAIFTTILAYTLPTVEELLPVAEEVLKNIR